MTEKRVINVTETIQDARMLLTCAIQAVEGGADIIDINEELTCTPVYMLKTVLDLLNGMAFQDSKLSEDAQLLMAGIKAQFAIADAQA